MLSIALVGYFKNDEMKQNTDVMEQLNLGLLTIIIIVAAAATVFTSFLGFMGAYFKSMLTLKLVRRGTGHTRMPFVCARQV
jgi:hypothetical protein